jgi:hypothetical protein
MHTSPNSGMPGKERAFSLGVPMRRCRTGQRLVAWVRLPRCLSLPELRRVGLGLRLRHLRNRSLGTTASA